MRVTKQMFKQLGKKDQVEYLEKNKKIKEDIPIGRLTRAMLYLWTQIFVISLIVLPLWKLAFGSEVFLNIGTLTINLFRLAPICIGVAFWIDIFLILIGLIKLDKLKKEYFHIEIKVKAKKAK